MPVVPLLATKKGMEKSSESVYSNLMIGIKFFVKSQARFEYMSSK